MPTLFDAIAHKTPDVPKTYFALTIMHPQAPFIEHHFIESHSPDKAQTMAEEFAEAGADVYVRTTLLRRPPKRGRGKKALSASASLLWVDLDATPDRPLEDLEELLATYTPRPSFLVYSGHGIHAYWQLNTPITDVDQLEGKTYALSQRLSADRCWNATQILRVPNTYNYKDPDNPLEVTTTLPDGEYPQYDPDDFPEVEPPSRSLTVDEQLEEEPLPNDFLNTLPTKLQTRLTTGEGAKVDPDTGLLDRSKNDFYIAASLLEMGYRPSQVLSVFTKHPEWTTHNKTRQKGVRYALDTIASAATSVTENKKTPATTLKDFVKDLRVYVDDKGVQKIRRINFPEEELYGPVRKYLKESGYRFISLNGIASMITPNDRLIPVELGPRSDFTLWLAEATGLTSNQSHFISLQTGLYASLTNDARTHQLPEAEPTGWCHYSLDNDNLYTLLNGTQRILRSPPETEPTNILNGSDNLLLRPSTIATRPIDWNPDVNIEEAFDGLYNRFTTYMACSDEAKDILELYTLAIPLFRGVAGLIQTIPLLHLRGPSGGGKTQALKLLATILHGEPTLVNATAAASYRVAPREIFLPYDDYDQMDASQRQLFLTSATGIQRQIADRNNDQGIVTQDLHLPVAVTSINEFDEDALRRRAFVIEISHSSYPTKDYTDHAWKQLQKIRSDFWSAYCLWISQAVAPQLQSRVDQLSTEISHLIPVSKFKALASPLALLFYLLECHPIFDTPDLGSTIDEWLVELSLTEDESADVTPIISILNQVFEYYDAEVDGNTLTVRGNEGTSYIQPSIKRSRHFRLRIDDYGAFSGTSTEWASTIIPATNGRVRLDSRKMTRMLNDFIQEQTGHRAAPETTIEAGGFNFMKLENCGPHRSSHGWRIQKLEGSRA